MVTVANFDEKVVARLQEVYKRVGDIDLFSAGKSGVTIAFFP